MTSLLFLAKVRYSDMTSKFLSNISRTLRAFGCGIVIRKLDGVSTSYAAIYRHLFGELLHNCCYLRWALRNLNDEVPMLDVLPLFEENYSVLVYAIGFSGPQINWALDYVRNGWSIEHAHIIDGKR